MVRSRSTESSCATLVQDRIVFELLTGFGIGGARGFGAVDTQMIRGLFWVREMPPFVGDLSK